MMLIFLLTIISNIYCCCLVSELCATPLQPHELFSLPSSSDHGISHGRILE